MRLQVRLIWLFVFSFLTLVPLAAFATPIVHWDDMQVKHAWPAVPADWESLGHPSAGTTIDIDIALKSDRESAAIDALSEISNPKHPRYRAFLSKEKLDELVKPSPDSFQLVSAWLAHHGIPSSSISSIHGGNWMTVTDLRLSQANHLLGASYRLYRNTKTNETTIRTVGYLLPAVLHTHIQTVLPTTCFPSMQMTLETPHRRSFGPEPAPAPAASEKLGTRLQPPAEPPMVVMPAIVRGMYGTAGYVPKTYDYYADRDDYYADWVANRFGVVGNRSPSRDDLTRFMVTFQAQSVDASFEIKKLDFSSLPFSSRTSSVAIQYASAMTYPTPLIYYGTRVDEVHLVGLLDLLLAEWDVIPTLSISYNYFREYEVSPELADLICYKFAQLGSRGASVLVASGNRGVGGGVGEDCKDGDGNIKFVPEFPSSCPWVTSVGGTQYINQVIAEGHSGGGFSYHYRRPDYQDSAVLEYFRELGDEYSGHYNPTGRGYPDISAQAAGCAIILFGDLAVSRGTACAVTTAAGVVSLLNDFLIRDGRKPLGFLNPWLYDVGSIGLTDITGGSNPGCGTDGFRAVTGWDPVTGLGTPNFGLLQSFIPPDSERPEFIPPPPP